MLVKKAGEGLVLAGAQVGEKGFVLAAWRGGARDFHRAGTIPETPMHPFDA
jgi:hypothetical protein